MTVAAYMVQPPAWPEIARGPFAPVVPCDEPPVWPVSRGEFGALWRRLVTLEAQVAELRRASKPKRKPRRKR